MKEDLLFYLASLRRGTPIKVWVKPSLDSSTGAHMVFLSSILRHMNRPKRNSKNGFSYREGPFPDSDIELNDLAQIRVLARRVDRPISLCTKMRDEHGSTDGAYLTEIDVVIYPHTTDDELIDLALDAMDGLSKLRVMNLGTGEKYYIPESL